MAGEKSDGEDRKIPLDQKLHTGGITIDSRPTGVGITNPQVCDQAQGPRTLNPLISGSPKTPSQGGACIQGSGWDDPYVQASRARILGKQGAGGIAHDLK